MRITSLLISNMLKIRALHLVPKGSVIELKGTNESGKTSILTAIVMGFKGKKEYPPMPLTKGQKKGIIKISLDGDEALKIPSFTITQSTTLKTTNTTIEPDTILAGETPRSFLDKLIGKISFDPQEFIDMEPQKQRQTLLELLGIDVDKLDRDEKVVFDERTVKGKEVKISETKLAGMNYWPDTKETEEKKIADLSKKLSEAMVHNQSIESRKTANSNLAKEGIKLKEEAIPQAKEKVSELELQLVQAKAKLQVLEEELVSLREKHNKEKSAIALLEPIDVSAINTELATIETTNARIRDNLSYKTEQGTLTTLKSQYTTLDTKLENLREKRIQIIQEAKFPVDGLSFDEDGLLYNNIPFVQCSSGAKLDIGMAISMELNPTVKVIRMNNWSLLGPEKREIIRKRVEGKGFQLWAEEVMGRDEYNKTGKMGVFIEEGIAEGDEVIVDEIVDDPEPETPKSKSKVSQSQGVTLPSTNAGTDEDW